jgi:hypothetical protein
MSPGRWGRGKTLTFDSARADNAGMSCRRTSPHRRAARRLGIERGQALVEFALIAPLFLMIVVGIIQFGVAINYWFDMQRLANQGARWAAVNAYPDCPQSAPQTVCTNGMPVGVTYLDGTSIPDRLHYELANERLTAGEDIKPYICFPGGATPAIGDAVTVRISKPFRFNAIVAQKRAAGKRRFQVHAPSAT